MVLKIKLKNDNEPIYFEDHEEYENLQLKIKTKLGDLTDIIEDFLKIMDIKIGCFLKVV